MIKGWSKCNNWGRGTDRSSIESRKLRKASLLLTGCLSTLTKLNNYPLFKKNDISEEKKLGGNYLHLYGLRGKPFDVLNGIFSCDKFGMYNRRILIDEQLPSFAR